MHQYSSDSPDRRSIPLALAGIAVAVAYLVSVTRTRLGFDPPWWLWIEPPSLAGLYWMLYAAFDNWAWRQRLFGWRPSRIRDLRGTWVGTLTSSHAAEVTVPVVVWVSQSWTRLRVRVETLQSASHSVAGAVLTEDAAKPGLSYQYVNEPKAFVSVETMHPHRGTASFDFGVDEETLDGEYYTGRGRSNHGSIRVRRISKTILPKEAALTPERAESRDSATHATATNRN